LAVWGLTADDIGLASFHGTSTAANDKNESDVLNTKLKHIGRTPGHVLPVVCQKWLTGHSKGAAAGYMLNGILQSMRTGLIPGNRNADNIDADFREYEYLLYLSKSVQTPGIKAALLTSFGFGQVGGELLIVHPDYLFAAAGTNAIDAYNIKLKDRDVKSYRYWQNTLVGNHPFIQVKDHPPYTIEQEKQVLLDPLARAHYDAKTKHLNCRKDATTKSDIVKVYNLGEDVDITCQVKGQLVSGTSVWDMTPDGCYVLDYYLQTGYSGIFKTLCSDLTDSASASQSPGSSSENGSSASSRSSGSSTASSPSNSSNDDDGLDGASDEDSSDIASEDEEGPLLSGDKSSGEHSGHTNSDLSDNISDDASDDESLSSGATGRAYKSAVGAVLAAVGVSCLIPVF
ncbi:fatty acid synthase alpha subunit Lsd1, partial [Coemansia erecta]